MEILTPRILLREFRLDDWRRVLAYQSDPQYLRFYSWDQRSEADARAFVHSQINYQHETPRRCFQLVIELRQSREMIGNVGIRVKNPQMREADIGYELDSRYWHHGYATEAARAMLAFGFFDLQLHRIYAECVAENEASWRVMERLGMSREGREREKDFIKGEWHDRLLYSILDHEWLERPTG